MNVGDLVQPNWFNGHEWDYFDVLPHGYKTWKRGEVGVVLSIEHRKPKKDSSCEVLHKGKIVIAFLYELRVIREFCPVNFNTPTG